MTYDQMAYATWHMVILRPFILYTAAAMRWISAGHDLSESTCTVGHGLGVLD